MVLPRELLPAPTLPKLHTLTIGMSSSRVEECEVCLSCFIAQLQDNFLISALSGRIDKVQPPVSLATNGSERLVARGTQP